LGIINDIIERSSWMGLPTLSACNWGRQKFEKV